MKQERRVLNRNVRGEEGCYIAILCIIFTSVILKPNKFLFCYVANTTTTTTTKTTTTKTTTTTTTKNYYKYYVIFILLLVVYTEIQTLYYKYGLLFILVPAFSLNFIFVIII
jgi:hypothetical protein